MFSSKKTEWSYFCYQFHRSVRGKTKSRLEIRGLENLQKNTKTKKNSNSNFNPWVKVDSVLAWKVTLRFCIRFGKYFISSFGVYKKSFQVDIYHIRIHFDAYMYTLYAQLPKCMFHLLSLFTVLENHLMGRRTPRISYHSILVHHYYYNVGI